MDVYLVAKFDVCSKILTSFRQGVIFLSQVMMDIKTRFSINQHLDTLELKKEKCIYYILLNGNQREYIIINLSQYILLSYIT